MEQIIIDGKNATMGRLASYAAKQSLLGKNVVIVNVNDVIIIGNKKDIVNKYLRKFQLGGSGLKGPKVGKSPEKLLKRVIRGMVSHKEGRGADAMKRIRCYNKIPQEYEESKKIIAGKEKSGKYISLKQLFEVIQ